jgi:hypothetical protein
MNQTAFRALAATACANLLSLHSLTACDKNETDRIVVRLTPQSKELVKEALKSLRVGDYDVEDVVLNSCADTATQQQLSDVYGRRVAFRMKGYVKTKVSGRKGPDGPVVTAAYGSVRGMGPVIETDGFLTSMPCIPAGSATATIGDSVTAAVDLPTRLAQSPHYQHFQRDVAAGSRDPSNCLTLRLGSTGATSSSPAQPALTVESVQLPFERQLVVDGYLCPSRLFDKDGRCTWEREVHGELATATAATDSAGAAEVVTPASSMGAKEEVSKGAVDEEDSKCPICAYMESGSCKPEFLAWQGCIDSLSKPSPERETEGEGASSSSGDVSLCFPQTQAMMQCFLKNEHYDIMVASMQDSMKQAFGGGETKDKNAADKPKRKAKKERDDDDGNEG